MFSKDEGPRADTSLEALAKLKPVFHAKGTVTAGNSSQTSDGAAAAVVMSRSRADALGIKPMGRFIAFAYAGCDPEEMGIGPIHAIPKVLKMAGLTLEDIGLFRAERGVRVAGAGRGEGAGDRPGEAECERRGDCAGASDGVHGR